MTINLRASSAPIWSNCPASTSLPSVPKESTPASLEGDLCHLIASNILQKKTTPGELEGVVTTEELFGLGSGAAEYCVPLTEITILSEIKVEGGSLPPGVEGTCDFIGFKKDTLNIVDFKFGFGSVKAKENKQLLVYSIGAMDTLKDGYDIKKIKFHIYQPRDFTGGAVKTWEISVATWREEVTKLRTSAQAALSGNGVAVTGEHCRYCASRTNCPAFLGDASHILESIQTDPEAVGVKSLGAELAYLRRAEAIIKSARIAFEDKIMSEIKEGRPVLGWQIGSTAGRRKWTASVDEIKAVAAMTGLDLIEEKPVSISAAWRNAASRPLLESLITKGEGSPKLVPFQGFKDE